MKKSIHIIYDDILKRIYTYSSYTAQAREKAGLPEEVSKMTMVTDDEKVFLENVISQAIDECIAIISLYLGPCSSDMEIAGFQRILNIEIPSNYPADKIDLLENITKEIIAFRCLEHWYLITRPEEANITNARLQLLHARMHEILTIRKKPEKEDYTQEEIL